MKKLLVLANEFPYGQTEPYMETEEKYYSNFDKVWIGSLQLRNTTAVSKRNLSSQAEVIPVWYKSRTFYLINSISVLFDTILYIEIKKLLENKKLSVSRLVTLFVFLSRAHHEARVVNKAIKGEKKDDILIYSYRFEYQPYVALLLRKWWKKSIPVVCRAHGYDLYEEQHRDNYIPLREYILRSVDYVFPCSKSGLAYLRQKYKTDKARVDYRYLGTLDHGIKKYSESKVLRVISCSNVNKVKRIDKIIDSLALIKDISIEWTHFGGGDLLEEIRSLAKQKLRDNITFNLPGNISNSDLYDRYLTENYRVFINVSSSEGLPVSIMESLSVGIPCIATDVGGTNEIVNERNGILLSKDATNEEIASAIRKILTMECSDYLKLRDNARRSWEKLYDANRNYTSFVHELQSFDSSI